MQAAKENIDPELLVKARSAIAESLSKANENTENQQNLDSVSKGKSVPINRTKNLSTIKTLLRDIGEDHPLHKKIHQNLQEFISGK